jgi:hypothetical protein
MKLIAIEPGINESKTKIDSSDLDYFVSAVPEEI